MTYTVYVDDNFHFSNEDERCTDSTHDTLEAAEARCQEIVGNDLIHTLQQGYAAKDLYGTWLMFGESPFVIGSKFSARDYAEQWCNALMDRQ